MAEWIEVLEIADKEGKGTGKFRRTTRSDESDLGPVGLCRHEHDTREEALACPDAQTWADRFSRNAIDINKAPNKAPQE